MKLRKTLPGDHYTHYWRGPILPDPYPPRHPRAPCHKCNQWCEEFVNWVEGTVRWMLFPTRRYRVRYALLGFMLFMSLILLNSAPTVYEVAPDAQAVHSPRMIGVRQLIFWPFSSAPQQVRKSSRPKKGLIQDWVFAPNCDALLRGDSEEVRFTKRMLYREVRDKVTDTEYLLQTKSCPTFRATEGYPTHALTAEEHRYPLAYLIQGYKNVEQLHRLLRAVYSPQNPYCICTNHKATGYFDNSVRSIANCFQNVFHISTLRGGQNKTSLSEMDDIKCARKCMKVLVQSHNWRYLIKIHSQDYPLAGNGYIASKLKGLERTNANFISDYGHMQKKQTVKVSLSNSSSDQTDVTLWRASPFFIASKTVVEQALASPLSYRLLPIIQTHEHPESYFWASLILHLIGNSNHAEMVAANKHRVELQAHKESQTKMYCAGITQLQDHCILGVEDLSKLFHHRQKPFFAHGFDLDRDHVAFGCLEQRLENVLFASGANMSEEFNDQSVHAKQPELKLISKLENKVPEEKEVDNSPAKVENTDQKHKTNNTDSKSVKTVHSKPSANNHNNETVSKSHENRKADIPNGTTVASLLTSSLAPVKASAKDSEQAVKTGPNTKHKESTTNNDAQESSSHQVENVNNTETTDTEKKAKRKEAEEQTAVVSDAEVVHETDEKSQNGINHKRDGTVSAAEAEPDKSGNRDEEKVERKDSNGNKDVDDDKTKHKGGEQDTEVDAKDADTTPKKTGAHVDKDTMADNEQQVTTSEENSEKLSKHSKTETLESTVDAEAENNKKNEKKEAPSKQKTEKDANEEDPVKQMEENGTAAKQADSQQEDPRPTRHSKATEGAADDLTEQAAKRPTTRGETAVDSIRSWVEERKQREASEDNNSELIKEA